MSECDVRFLANYLSSWLFQSSPEL